VAAISPTNVWAVGSFAVDGKRRLAAHYDGTSWTVTPTPADGSVYATLDSVSVVPGTNRVWAVGSTAPASSNGSPVRPLALRWDGHRWKESPAGGLEGTFDGVTAITPGDTWAVGWRVAAGPGYHTRPLAEHFGNDGWKVVPTPAVGFPDASFSSVDGTARGDVWAVGSGIPSGQGERPLTEHWDGSAWHNIPNPGSRSANSGFLFSVSAVSRDDVWAAGGNDSLVLHWSGNAWSESPLPSVSAHNLTGIDALPSGSTWAVGYGLSSPSVIEHWKGSRWNSTTSPPSVRVLDDLS